MFQASPSPHLHRAPRRPTVCLRPGGAATLLLGISAALILRAVLTEGASAQVPPPRPNSASLGGLVVDAETAEPLVGATVMLVAEGSEQVKTVTDPDGRFMLLALEPGEHVVRIHFGGRAAVPRRIRLPAGYHIKIRVSVSLADADRTRGLPVAELPPLEVEIEGEARPGKLRGFYERRSTGPGHFISGAEIRERSPLRSSDLMRRVPGMVITEDPGGRHGVGVGRSGRCSIDFYLDGMPAPGLRLDDIPPDDIGGLEIYRGASEVPIKYRRPTTCAAILIWTWDPGEP